MPHSRRAAAALAALLAATPAAAFEASGGPVAEARARGGGVSVTLEAAVGAIEGKGYERVYYYPAPGERFKVSQLDWDLEGVAAAGLRAELGLGGRFSASASLWRSVSGGSGSMVDRDWLYLWADSDEWWTHESRHPDTTVEEATLLDLRLAWRALRLGPVSVSALGGVRRDTFAWSSRGGTYVYSDIENGGFRDRSGRFPDRTVIDYEQVYTAPYLGLGLGGGSGALAVEGHVLASPAVRGTDRDYHVLRDTLFEGDFSGGGFVELGLRGTWRVTPRFFLAAAIEAMAYREMVGDVTVTEPDAVSRFPDGGAMEVSATVLSLGAGLQF